MERASVDNSSRENLRPTNVRLSADQLAALDELASENASTRSQMVRLATEQFISARVTLAARQESQPVGGGRP
jgi:metal-responsive CopG/Arc/MetJ family transcriptional regulator